jgi:preprotein translocase subunit SecF
MELVGPKVGADLRKKGFWAVVYANVGILIYLAWRFEPRFGLGAVVALIHDAIVVIGAFSLLNKEIDLTIVAAILTIIGYSVYDTVVVFDRIRENMHKSRKQAFETVVNISINETLNRTLLTSSTTLITVITLFILGGPVVHDFAFALMVGVIVGTYSSIYIASPIVIYWEGLRVKMGVKRRSK